jgi:hypothetical protein
MFPAKRRERDANHTDNSLELIQTWLHIGSDLMASKVGRIEHPYKTLDVAIVLLAPLGF